ARGVAPGHLPSLRRQPRETHGVVSAESERLAAGDHGSHHTRWAFHYPDAAPRAGLSYGAALVAPQWLGGGRPMDEDVPQCAEMGWMKAARALVSRDRSEITQVRFS